MPTTPTTSPRPRVSRSPGAGPQYGIHLVVLCPAIVLGPGDYRITPSNQLVMDWLNGRGQTYTGRPQPGGCRDVAAAHVAALERGPERAAAMSSAGKIYRGGDRPPTAGPHRCAPAAFWLQPWPDAVGGKMDRAPLGLFGGSRRLLTTWCMRWSSATVIWIRGRPTKLSAFSAKVPTKPPCVTALPGWRSRAA